MAKKPFEIQDSRLRMGGVDLQAGTTGVVIPGITQATSYTVEEVDETDVDQTNTLNLPIVIDNVTHVAKVADAGANVSAYATYTVELDDEDYVDEIEVNTAGTYVGSEVDRNADFDMWGYTGSDAEGYFTNWVTGDWIQIPFRPKMRAGDVENIGGSGNMLTNGDWQAYLNDGGTLRIDNADTEQNYVKFTAIQNEDNTYGVLLDVDNQAGWTFLDNGNIQFPDGSIQTTAYTSRADSNIWVETFESNAPTADFVQAATSVEYDADGNVIALFSHYEPGPDSTYTSVAKLTPTGAVLWKVRFAANLNSDGWGLAYNTVDDIAYVAGRTSGTPLTYEFATLTKLNGTFGNIIWSKTYDFEANSTSLVVDVDGDGNPVMVGYSYNGTDNYIITTKVDSADGSVIWSKTLDGQGDDQAYGMAVGPANEIVTIGYVDQYSERTPYSVTPLTGSTVDVLVVNRNELFGFADTWQVAGTGIAGYAGISAINFYNALTGTTREGSGAVFNITDNGNGTYSVAVDDQGNNYLAGHKIKILGTDLGGSTPVNDCIITVDSNDVQTGMVVSNTGTAAGTVPATYNLVTGTNYQVGSGLAFDFAGDSGSTYTEHTTNIFAAGTNYVTGDVITIPGTQLGGTTPANDLIATVSSSNGAVTQFNSFSGNQQTTTYRVMVENSTVDFSGPGSWTLSVETTDNADRMVVVKYATDGTIAWQKAIQFDAGYDCRGADADIDSNGNIYVCGSYQYDYQTYTTSAMSLVKFNSSGVKQWSRRVVGNCDTFGTSVVVGDDDQLYLSGITGTDNPSDYTWVVAKYNTDGVVTWQRLIDNTTTWTFGGSFWFSGGGGSNIAVKSGYVALAGAFGDIGTHPIAVVLQIDTDATPFSVGDWDIKGATFSGVLNGTASDITVVDANKEVATVSPAVGTFASGEDLSNFLSVTRYGGDSSTSSLINGAHQLVLESTGALTLPAGGTITEGYVTSNPTIQLTPATPTVASQKLVIKGGSNYVFTDNGIEINYNNNTALVGDTLTFYVYSNTYANQTLYWWIYPQGAGIGDTESDTVVMNGSSGMFSIFIDSDDYEFTVRVSPEADNYDPANVGVETGLINADSPTFDADHHLHLTTGNLTETSIFLGTDNHNVRTTVNGGIEITTPNEGNNVWKFDASGQTTFPTLTVPISDNATPNGTGQTLKFSDSTQQAIIFGPASTADNTSAERVIIQGAPGYTDTSGEGGDVYLWAGPGGSAGGNGGDIKVRAGQGIGSGQGGYLNFQAGDSQSGQGGYVNIESGEGATDQGGSIGITARNGGQLSLYTSQNGNITLNTGSGTNVWTFSPTGTTTLPGAVVKSTVIVSTPLLQGVMTNFVSGPNTDPGWVDGNYNVTWAGGGSATIVIAAQTLNTISNIVYGTNVWSLNDVVGSFDVGGLVPFVITVDGIEDRAPINLNKSINCIGAGTYTLADGVEGQIMYLVPDISEFNISDNVIVTVAHGRDQANQMQDWDLWPFDYYVGAQQVPTSICTLIFTQGHWQQVGGHWD